MKSLNNREFPQSGLFQSEHLDLFRCALQSLIFSTKGIFFPWQGQSTLTSSLALFSRKHREQTFFNNNIRFQLFKYKRCIILFSPMASNWNEEDEQAEVVINPETDTSAYNQLWQEALEVDDEVMRILQEHGEQVIDDETEIATDAMEEGGINHAHLGILRDYFSSFVK
ncbi:hypothetical protein OUZ56_015602 [Daphnia magna]|uniref:Uncharacterized protein n=1 Tax=Daphnia magna TaxID=35525 RepID=A0ABR0ANB7_9CRUS|nr:hypothetical protein OUZ56_015602 [Daphnia magna]